MIRKKNIFLLLTLAMVLFCCRNPIINGFIESNPDFNMMTGSMTAIDNNTLVFRYNKELVVFEHKNGRWRYHSRFSVAKLMHSKEISSIAVKGDIIAVGVTGVAYTKGAVGIYQRNTKDNGWGLLKVLRDPEPPLFYSDNIVKDSLFGGQVVVTENYEVVTGIGHPGRVDAGLYVYDCRSEAGSKLYVVEPAAAGFREAFKSYGGTGGEPVYSFYKSNTNRYILSGTDTLLLRVPYLDTADASNNKNIVGRIVVFRKKGNAWEAGGVIGADHVNRIFNETGIPAETTINWSVTYSKKKGASKVEIDRINETESTATPEIHRLGGFMAFSKGRLSATINRDIYEFERNGDGLWEPVENYRLPETLQDTFTLPKGVHGVYKVAFDPVAGETVAVTVDLDVKRVKEKVRIHRKTGSGWKAADEIIPEDLPQMRRDANGLPLEISNGLLVSNGVIVVCMERPPYKFPRVYDYYGDDIFALFIYPFLEPPMDTAKLNKYPGRVCIYRLLPEKGYVLEDIIVRDRDKKGRLYFKSAIY